MGSERFEQNKYSKEKYVRRGGGGGERQSLRTHHSRKSAVQGKPQVQHREGEVFVEEEPAEGCVFKSTPIPPLSISFFSSPHLSSFFSISFPSFSRSLLHFSPSSLLTHLKNLDIRRYDHLPCTSNSRSRNLQTYESSHTSRFKNSHRCVKMWFLCCRVVSVVLTVSLWCLCEPTNSCNKTIQYKTI